MNFHRSAQSLNNYVIITASCSAVFMIILHLKMLTISWWLRKGGNTRTACKYACNCSWKNSRAHKLQYYFNLLKKQFDNGIKLNVRRFKFTLLVDPELPPITSTGLFRSRRPTQLYSKIRNAAKSEKSRLQRMLFVVILFITRSKPAQELLHQIS